MNRDVAVFCIILVKDRNKGQVRIIDSECVYIKTTPFEAFT